MIAEAGVIRSHLRETDRGHIRNRKDDGNLLAFVRHFPVIADNRLLYREGKGVLRVIMASHIHELIGLVSNDKSEYIIR